MFGTLINDIDCYDETSATAGIDYDIKRVIKSKYIKDEYIAVPTKAEEVVIKELNSSGEVDEVRNSVRGQSLISDVYESGE